MYDKYSADVNYHCAENHLPRSTKHMNSRLAKIVLEAAYWYRAQAKDIQEIQCNRETILEIILWVS